MRQKDLPIFVEKSSVITKQLYNVHIIILYALRCHSPFITKHRSNILQTQLTSLSCILTTTQHKCREMHTITHEIKKKSSVLSERKDAVFFLKYNNC